jgi:steroid delta-isomerase-like uncharacterized protein
MSEANKAAARRYEEEVWGKGNFEAERELVDRDLVDHNAMPGFPSGFEGHHRILVATKQALPDARLTVEEVVAEGDKVVVRWRTRATHSGDFMGLPATGKKVEFTGMDMMRFDNGRIREIWHNEDILGLLRQLGAVPEPGR